MYLKEKADGKIKGRGCADGRKQRAYIDKSDAASPTVSIEAVFITSVIDALEGRDVATADIPGAYLHADYDAHTLVRFDSTMAELLVKINPKFINPTLNLVVTAMSFYMPNSKKPCMGAYVRVYFFGKICRAIFNARVSYLTPMTPVWQIKKSTDPCALLFGMWTI
jgi:hypothetical protein